MKINIHLAKYNEMEICVQNSVETLITSKNGYPAEQLHSRDNATNALNTRIGVSCVEWNFQ